MRNCRSSAGLGEFEVGNSASSKLLKLKLEKVRVWSSLPSGLMWNLGSSEKFGGRGIV
jgi:hypothetical protein